MPNEAAENKDVLHPLEDHHNDIAHHDDRKISKRIRWATQKHPEASGEHKRHAILRRISQRKANHEKSLSNTSTTSKPDGQPQQNDNEGPGRRIFFNLTLPDNARDEHGRPISHYPRNKIRTAKYTPISFVPKNLWFQFQNIANIYFLFIIILGVSFRLLLQSRTSFINTLLVLCNLWSYEPGIECCTSYRHSFHHGSERCY